MTRDAFDNGPRNQHRVVGASSVCDSIYCPKIVSPAISTRQPPALHDGYASSLSQGRVCR